MLVQAKRKIALTTFNFKTWIRVLKIWKRNLERPRPKLPTYSVWSAGDWARLENIYNTKSNRKKVEVKSVLGVINLNWAASAAAES
jgi:hypothetical protein